MSAPDPTSRLWLRVFFAGLAVVVVLLAITLNTRPFYGDLTRVGMLSEDDFGWRAPQPVPDAALLRSVTLREADVVVLGDSFSRPLLWQAELVRAGLKVKTIDWPSLGPLCHDFTAWLRARGYRGHRLLIESAEREFDGRLLRAETCERMPPSAWRDEATVAPPPTALPPERRLNTDERLTTGVAVHVNTARARRLAGDHTFGDEDAQDRTRIVPTPDGCRWFSHRACGKMLLLGRDSLQTPLGSTTLARMQALAAGQPELDITWLVVPAKSTIYLDVPRGFWTELARRGLGPDLAGALVEARERVIDLYRPNDTHLSTTGFGVLGQLALRALQAPSSR